MNQGDLSQFADAIISPKSASELKSYIPEVEKFFSGQARNDFVTPIGKGAATASGEIGRANEQKRQASVSARKEDLQRRLDPGNYERKRKDDGGFAFYDPDGKEIDIATYAKVTGRRRADILSDSENPLDLKYLADYQDTLGVINAINTGDVAALQEYSAAQPALKGMTPDELLKRLMKQYPHMYGMGSYDQTRQINADSFAENNRPGYVPFDGDPQFGGQSTGGFQL